MRRKISRQCRSTALAIVRATIETVNKTIKGAMRDEVLAKDNSVGIVFAVDKWMFPNRKKR